MSVSTHDSTHDASSVLRYRHTSPSMGIFEFTRGCRWGGALKGESVLIV
jgi:hypothetical protein